MREYLYGMRLRPAGPGAQPIKGLLRIAPGGGQYHDLLIYDRKLTDEELEEYELDYINDVWREDFEEEYFKEDKA